MGIAEIRDEKLRDPRRRAAVTKATNEGRFDDKRQRSYNAMLAAAEEIGALVEASW